MEFSFSNIIATIKELVLNTKDFWRKKKEETGNSSSLFVSYFVPLLVVVAVAVFVGEFFKRSDFFIEYPLFKAARETMLFVLQYYIGVFFTKELMKTFGAPKDADVAKLLVVYSMTPLLLVSIVTGLFQGLYPLDILGVASFYLFWVGAKELLSFPDHKENSYILLVILANFFTFSILSVILSQLLKAYY